MEIPASKTSHQKQIEQMKSKTIREKLRKGLISLFCSMLSEIDSEQIEMYRKEDSVSLVLFLVLKNKFGLVCMFCFVLNAIMNGDIVSLAYPVIFFGYALIENPFPIRAFWKAAMYYTIAVISIKFLY